MPSPLRQFVADVDRRRQRSHPEVPMQTVPKDLLYAARDFIENRLKAAQAGGRVGKGGRPKKPESELSQTPRAIRARQSRSR